MKDNFFENNRFFKNADGSVMNCDECMEDLFADDYYYELDGLNICEDCYDSIMYERKKEACKKCSDFCIKED